MHTCCILYEYSHVLKGILWIAKLIFVTVDVSATYSNFSSYVKVCKMLKHIHGWNNKSNRITVYASITRVEQKKTIFIIRKIHTLEDKLSTNSIHYGVLSQQLSTSTSCSQHFAFMRYSYEFVFTWHSSSTYLREYSF